ncbi:MAG: hypothetical protein PHQ23_16345, partial [Candidatus Wallbacteria bacterium]|nr:hypothetical protein [Candidatus Wallbacteria bacterium]
VLHAFRLPFRGIILASLGFFIMLTLRQLVPKAGVILLAALVAVSIRLLTANQQIVNITLAIMLEAAGWEIVIALFRRDLLLILAGGLYTSLVCSCFFVITMMLFGGMKWEQVYAMYVKQALFFKPFFPSGADPVILYVGLEAVVTLGLFYAAVKSNRQLSSRISRINR